MDKVLAPAVRRWLYGVFTAALALAVGLGYVDPETAVLVLPLLLAFFNVPKSTPPDEGGV